MCDLLNCFHIGKVPNNWIECQGNAYKYLPLVYFDT